eukprot:379472_1
MVSLKWSTVAAIVYFALYFTLLFSLALYIHLTEEHEDKKSFFQSLWKRRGIFGQIIVHLYDTATDLGVLIEWYLLMKAEENGQTIEAIDMTALFWTTIAFLILYRVTSCCCGCVIGVYDHSDPDESETQVCLWLLFDGCCLGLLDLYIIKVVYNSIKNKAAEATARQKMFQLGEAISESLPQVVLQSVFIIRGYNDPVLSGNNTLTLVGMSLMASLFSIANKYCWVDENDVKEEAREAEIKTKCPLINWRYVLRIIWRFSYVMTRFCIISMTWSVMGGAFCGIFLAFSWVLWTIVVAKFVRTSARNEAGTGWDAILYFVILWFGYGFIALVASPASDKIIIAITHGIEMIITITLITTFAFVESIDCSICADPVQRQATNNPFIMMFLIAAWISMIIDFITYFILIKICLFNTNGGISKALGEMIDNGMKNYDKVEMIES